MKKSFYLLTGGAMLATLAFGVETKTWTQDEYSAFAKGEASKLALSSDGRIRLAPVIREIHDTSSVYLWALAEDSKGNLYAGGGGPGGTGAKFYMIPPGGKGKEIAELEGLEVHSIVIDKSDRVYAATSPDGRVYRMANGGKPEVFYDAKSKYIWAMAFGANGDLYVATGDQGQVHRVTPAGKGEVFYETGETHARSLAVDREGNLIVGTEPGGLIIRVSPKGEGFVLYQTPKREVTAVSVARDGAIWAAAVGHKGATPLLPASPVVPVQPAPIPSASGAAVPQTQASGAASALRPPASPAAGATGVTGGTEVYRIDKEGFPRKVWSDSQAIAYAIAFDSEARPVIGTGNKGVLYRIDSDLVYTELPNLPPTQVTSLYAGRAGKMYATTGNVGKVYQVGPGLEKEGALESDVFDTELFSYWGRLSYHGNAAGGQVAFETRSGNLERPQKDWSPWSGKIAASEGGRIASPPARFLQWRVTLQASKDGRSPELNAVDVAYMPRNVAPVFEAAEVTPANYRFPASTLTATVSQNITLPPLGRRSRQAPRPSAGGSGSASSAMQAAEGYLGVRWAVSDENDDGMSYSVFIRGDKETEWKLLEKELEQKQYSWDSRAFADGEYRIRVVASDAPDNTAGRELTAEVVTDPFVIDNTPPAISGLTAAIAGGKLEIRWRAADELSLLSVAEYSVNGREWTVAEPTTRLTDSREHEYVVAIDRPAGAEHTVAVRVFDANDNTAVGKVVVR